MSTARPKHNSAPPWLVAEFKAPAVIAVWRAMEKHHEENPIRYHRDRPGMKVCIFDGDCSAVVAGRSARPS